MLTLFCHAKINKFPLPAKCIVCRWFAGRQLPFEFDEIFRQMEDGHQPRLPFRKSNPMLVKASSVLIGNTTSNWRKWLQPSGSNVNENFPQYIQHSVLLLFGSTDPEASKPLTMPRNFHVVPKEATVFIIRESIIQFSEVMIIRGRKLDAMWTSCVKNSGH